MTKVPPRNGRPSKHDQPRRPHLPESASPTDRHQPQSLHAHTGDAPASTGWCGWVNYSLPTRGPDSDDPSPSAASTPCFLHTPSGGTPITGVGSVVITPTGTTASDTTPTDAIIADATQPPGTFTGPTTGTAVSSAYPNNDFNRQKKLGVQTAILVRVHFPQDPNGQVSWPPPDQPAAAQQMFDAVRLLSETNAYERGFSVRFQPNPTPGENADYFEIDLPGPVGDFFRQRHMFDAIAAFGVKYPAVPIHAFDRVVFLTPKGNLPPPGGGYFAQAIGMYTQFTDDAPIALGPVDFAPGVMHEMFHGYGFPHANTFDAVTACEDENECTTQYGDTYDFMGDVSYLGWRFHAGCYPSQIVPTFAPSTEVHLNPIHKWQLGWLDDADIRVIQPGEVLQGANAIPLAGIHGASGIRAILVERGINANGTPESVLVYWRDNEPQISNGVCIAYVSREQKASDTRMLDFTNAPLSTQNCLEAASPIPLTVSWAVGQGWSDPGKTVAKVRCPSPAAGGVLMVEIDNSAQTTRPLAGLPVVEVSCPILASGKVITNADDLVIYLTATVPDLDPNKEGWQGIDHLEVSFMQGEAEFAGPVFFDNGQPGFFLPAQCLDISEPTLMRIEASRFRATSDPLSVTPLRKVVSLGVVAVTTDGKRLANGLRFLIDQTIGTQS